MKQIALSSLFLLTVAALMTMVAPDLNAYDRYYNGSNGNCAACHGNFYSKYHSLHIGGSDAITGTCNLCHTGGSYGNPLIMWSGINGGNGLGCTGCHGRDYGETIIKNYGGYPTAGKPKSSGYGLRKYHKNHGYNQCLSCHVDVIQEFIEPEHVNPPYFSRNDVHVGGESMFACDNEDTGNDGDSVGLDNDGDGRYDANDSDCALTFNTHVIDDDTGGTVDFALDAGASKASRKYYVLGSLSGTAPGTPLPGGTTTMPLNWDLFTDLALALSINGSPVFADFLGTLDGNGEGSAQLNAPPSPGIAGTVIDFVFILDWPWEFASNPNPVKFVP